MKELFIVRHAKSSWENRQLRDFDRPLNPRGKRTAPIVAQRLRKEILTPDLICSSPANRALSTAKIFAEELDYPTSEIVEEISIYESSLNNMLELIYRFSDEYDSIMLFGHNPTFTFLAEYLSGNSFGNLPTAATVGIRFDIDNWKYVSRETGEVFLYEYPKKYQA